MSESSPNCIACELYDELESLATLKDFCEFQTQKSFDENPKGYIKDFKIINGEEYLILDTGESIKLVEIQVVKTERRGLIPLKRNNSQSFSVSS